MSVLSKLIYFPLQVLFIPAAIVGAMLVAYKQLVVSKRLRPSQTAVEVINGRCTMHIFGLRKDDATAKLAAALPNTSLPGVWLALFPLWVQHKLSGKQFLYPKVAKLGAEKLGDMMISRTLYCDQVLERVIGDAGKVVLVGAGYDTRAYGPLRTEDVAWFELDHKRAMLAQAGIDAVSTIFVTVDFSQDDVFEKLGSAGFDPNVKTVFLWRE